MPSNSTPADPLARFRDRFMWAEDGPIYLDGNSLGPLRAGHAGQDRRVVGSEWGAGPRAVLGHVGLAAQEVGDLVGEHLTAPLPAKSS
jgi:kynureninase